MPHTPVGSAGAERDVHATPQAQAVLVRQARHGCLPVSSVLSKFCARSAGCARPLHTGAGTEQHTHCEANHP